VLALGAAAIATGFVGHDLRQKFLPAMFAAKVKSLAVAFGVESGGFIYSHSANGILGGRFRFFHRRVFLDYF
jgi:hypothetical protein